MNKESSQSGWHKHSKLIGYGLFSLVFHPAFVLPNRSRFPEITDSLEKNPSRFIGLVTTRGHYEKHIQTTTQWLKELTSRHSHLAGMIVFPFPLSKNEDYMSLQHEDVQKLVEMHHAARKKVEYEKSWAGSDLVQLIYPYAGEPLERLYKKPKRAPGWFDFFQAIAEVARFLIALHEQGYVHGDLSPNNLLYLKANEKNGRITVVDWNMLSRAGDFLQQKKGRVRVGCWSPEHFSLTTARRQDIDINRHWIIYAEEMRKYIQRLLDFSFPTSSKAAIAIRDYFEPYVNEQLDPVFQRMFQDLEVLSHHDADAIGKYHDIRYLMDTIAKCVSGIFPDRSPAQQNQYNFFISLCLAQNLPDRKLYLEKPAELGRRLLLILQSCQFAEQGTPLSNPQLDRTTDSERTLLNLLQQ